MRGMSNILGIHPGRFRLLTQRAELKGEALSGTVASRAAVPPNHSRLVVRGNVPIERDEKHAAHAAHAFDPSVLDAGVARTDPPDREPSIWTMRIPRLRVRCARA